MRWSYGPAPSLAASGAGCLPAALIERLYVSAPVAFARWQFCADRDMPTAFGSISRSTCGLYLLGANVTSWVLANGSNVLYVRDDAFYDGVTPIECAPTPPRRTLLAQPCAPFSAVQCLLHILSLLTHAFHRGAAARCLPERVTACVWQGRDPDQLAAGGARRRLAGGRAGSAAAAAGWLCQILYLADCRRGTLPVFRTALLQRSHTPQAYARDQHSCRRGAAHARRTPRRACATTTSLL